MPISNSTKKIKHFLGLVLFASVLFSGNIGLAADICKEGLKELNGSQGVVQAKGGVWGYLEQSKALRSESILGLQIDGKLQRLIVAFEDLCGEGKTPTPSLHSQILSLIGDARMVFNRSADSRKKETLLETLNNLNKKIDELLAKLPS